MVGSPGSRRERSAGGSEAVRYTAGAPGAEINVVFKNLYTRFPVRRGNNIKCYYSRVLTTDVTHLVDFQ